MRYFISRKNVALLLLALLGLLIFAYLTPRIFSLLPSHLAMDRSELVSFASKQAAAMGYNVQNYDVHVTLSNNHRLLQYIQNRYTDDQRQVVLQTVPAYYWQVLWYEPKTRVKMIGDLDQEREPAKYTEKGLTMNFDLAGRAIAFRLTEQDSGPVQNLSEVIVAAIADSVLAAGWQGKPKERLVSRVSHAASDRSTSYGFLYTFPQKQYGLNVRFRVEMYGKHVKKWEYIYEPDGAPEPPSRGFESIRIISFIILLIFYAVFFIKRLRDDVIDFRHAMPIPILMGLTTLVIMLGVTWVAEYGEFFGPILAALVVSTAVIWVAYACSDSMVREVWEDKLLSLDALYKGYFYNRRFGVNVLAGFVCGLMALGGISLILYFVGRWTLLDMIPWSTEFDSMITWSPFFYSFCRIVNKTLWLQFGVVLFVLSLLAHYFSKPIWIIGASALVWGIGLHDLINLPTSPIWVNMLVAAFIGAVQAYAFVKWDFLASIITQAVWVTGFALVHLFMLDHPAFYWSIAGLLLLWMALLVIAAAALSRPVSEETLKRFLPVHAVKIIERMRLRRELEIAREVQLGFLPKKDPQVPGLDVASLCLPALEVGGDYYDFITLDDHRLGLAIGDVSGKGISAAFHMTLTKGFLRSLTRTSTGPRQVMMEMNRLYYDNVDRVHFISMIYGVFDTWAKTLTFVRAGHNPVISMQQKKSVVMTPNGLALGLEKGEIFDQVLEEKAVKIEPGDLFVFYTDGFSEARNHRLEEFGEERLAQTLIEHQHQSAVEILAAVKKQVLVFAGRGLQHDDMTMVVVRVTL